MMQIRCLPSCHNFELPNVPRKQNPRRPLQAGSLKNDSPLSRQGRQGEEAAFSFQFLSFEAHQPLIHLLPDSRPFVFIRGSNSSS